MRIREVIKACELRVPTCLGAFQSRCGGALGTHGNHSGLHSRDSLGTLYSELSYTRRKHSGPDIWNGWVWPQFMNLHCMMHWQLKNLETGWKVEGLFRQNLHVPYSFNLATARKKMFCDDHRDIDASDKQKPLVDHHLTVAQIFSITQILPEAIKPNRDR